MGAVEKQQHDAIGLGIDALYVTCSSPNIAPATAKLLRNSGLFPPPQQNKSNTRPPGHGNEEEEEDDQPIRDNDNINSNNEFRLKFHWMRPHPSLAFALEETLSLATKNDDGSSGEDNNNSKEPAEGDANNNTNNTLWKGGTNIDPAVESTRLMDAYRSSQMITNTPKQQQQQQQKQQQDSNVPTNQDNDDTNNSKNKMTLNISAATDTARFSIPLELPTLCINLTELIEPPLMMSWLPGEDYDISCDSDDDEGGYTSA
jgi:hypothetical protein